MQGISLRRQVPEPLPEDGVFLALAAIRGWERGMDLGRAERLGIGRCIATEQLGGDGPPRRNVGQLEQKEND